MNRKPTFLWPSLALLLWVAGCTSTSHRAPVEDRAAGARPVAMAPAPAAAASSPATDAVPIARPPAPEPAIAEGYVVKPGDTLIRIGLDSGQNWRDIARWNGLEDPYPLRVGQNLRVTPPPGEVDSPLVVSSAPTSGSEVRPSAASAPVVPPAQVTGSVAASASPSPTAAPTVATGEGGLNWMWPSAGPVLTGFNEVSSKGLSIGGKAGDPVLAAADGRVVYAGSGLRGYGNLVIVKHDSTFLTAYAHNQALLVKEDQAVRRGQKIAEMGSSDADRVKLHFEIRRQGKPVDPAKYLPAR
jgi:lipoprotein NlpD